MKYHYLRMFLTEVEQPPLLVEAGNILPRVARDEYLLEWFSTRIDFEHRKGGYVFAPIGQEEVADGVVCLGRIGRQVQDVINEPPETGFEEREVLTWRAANVLIDTRSSRDGQKVAFQYRGDVGKPLPLFSSLVEHINGANADAGWLVEVNVMTEVSTFWDAAKEHKGEITAAEFTFVTPNVLRMRTQMNEDLKTARRNHNALRVRVGLENKMGNLNLDGDDVKDAVDYVSEGGGTAKLKSGKKVLYDSEKAERAIEMEEDEPLNAKKKSTWKRFIDRLFP